jgi:hypothetical protein
VSRAGVRVIHSNYHQLFSSSSSSSSFLLFFFVHVHQLLRLLLLFSFLYSSSLSIRVVHSLTHSHMIVKTKCDHHFPLPLCLSFLLQFIHVDLAPSSLSTETGEILLFFPLSCRYTFSIRFSSTVDSSLSLRCVFSFFLILLFFCF